MVGVVHDGQTNTGRSKSHYDAKSQKNRIAGVQPADHKKIRDQIQAEHEDGFCNHFTIAISADLMSLKVFVYPFCNGREEFRKGGRKLKLRCIHFL